MRPRPANLATTTLAPLLVAMGLAPLATDLAVRVAPSHPGHDALYRRLVKR